MPKLYIVMYHYVRNLKYSRFPELKGLDLELFKEQIKFLKNNFNIIRMEDVIAYYTENYVLPENAVLLTFDDGYSDNYLNVFPILQEEKLQGSFFIPAKTFIEHQVLDVNKVHFVLASTNINNLIQDLFQELDYYRGREYDIPSNQELFHTYAKEERFDKKETIFVKRLLQTVLPEKLRNRIASNMFDKYVGLSEEKFAYELYVNYEQIKCMKRAGMYIGIHGYNHYWLGNLEVEKMQKDIKRALEVMGDMVVSDSWVMNYPYGSYNDEVISYIKDKGCVLGLTTDVKIADLSADNRYLLPRLDTNDFPPKSENYTKIH
ncbi:MAG: polysaccharide deacetylase family protein [Lachnospiraceae bacterium]|jgi:peptidoglycan/xylan/chitin deacetylase (PgdA/CDA1 family)|nr:polysaccharide deacetylase family protein [Lachnospiraceae bacterium]